MKILIIILTIIPLFSCSSSPKKEMTESSQKASNSEIVEIKSYPDSSNYWLNKDYLMCIKNGRPVCYCLSENEMVILNLQEKKGKLLVQSSVFHFGLETSVEFEINTNEYSDYVVKQVLPLKDSISINKKLKNLIVGYNGETIVFVNQKLKTLDIPTTPKGIFTFSSDIFDQRNNIDAQSILSYPITFNTDSTKIFYTYSQIEKLIRENRISISCSDDFHFNSMLIKGEPNRYFHLEYQDDYLLLYDEKEGRERGEKLDLNNLEKQIFYKK